ncbi:MAG: hypothetical protein ACW98Y_06805 [Candidatus Thorarchaeota archaeon]|jgi:hypothetical protein
MKPVKVTVFTTTSSEHGLHVGEVGPQDPSDDNCADGSCDPSSGPAVIDEAAKLKKCVDEVKAALGDSVMIEVIDYEDDSSRERGMEIVNQAFASAGTDTIDAPERFTMFVNSSAPLFIVQDKIASTGVVPPSYQIVSRVKAALR